MTYEAEHPDYPMRGADRGPGAVDMLRDQADRLHHQIELLSQRLAPVMRQQPSEASAKVAGITESALDDLVRQVAAAVERLVDIQDRLVI